MPIEPTNFLLYWLGAFVVLAVILFRRPKPGGVTLRLKSGSRAKADATPVRASRDVTTGGPAVARERSLNVIFQFNGHSWDAYEVLGVPAGSNYETVKAAYVEALEGVDPTSRPFMEAAFRAIDAASKR